MKLNLSQKFLLILLIPLCAIVIFATAYLGNAYDRYSRNQTVIPILEITSQLIQAVSGVQKERGYTLGWLADNQQTQLQKEIQRQQEVVDQTLEELQTLLAKQGGLIAKMVRIDSILDALDSVRRRSNQPTSTSNQVLADYTELIERLYAQVQGTINQIEEGRLIQEASQIIPLMSLLELYGQERGMVFQILSNKTPTGSEIPAWKELKASVSAFERYFNIIANDDLKQHIREALAQEAVGPASTIRNQLTSPVTETIDYSQLRQSWWDSQSIKIDSLIAEANHRIKEVIKQAQLSAEAEWLTVVISLVFTAAVLTVACLLTLWSLRDIVGRIRRLISTMKNVADKNLNVAIADTGRHDEIGDLARGLEVMVQNLAALTINIRSGTFVVSDAVNSLHQNLKTNSLGISETSSAIEETSTSIEELRKSFSFAQDKSEQVYDAAQRSVDIAQRGEACVGKTVKGIEVIRDQTQSMSKHITVLSKQTEEIGNIVDTVKDLSEQSNLLAVNAAIEAEKVGGEQGRGFSVVAEQVKSLAKQSKEAVTQIKEILGQIQATTRSVVLATEHGEKAVAEGLDITEETRLAFQELSSCVQNTADAIELIKVTTNEQQVGVEQVTTAMRNIRQASTQGKEMIGSLEKSNKTLTELGDNLLTLVEQYQVSTEEGKAHAE